MPKPTLVPVWSTDANYTGGAEAGTPTKVTPTAGKIAEGFEPQEEPAAQTLNDRLNLIGQWATWLNGIVAGASKRFVVMKTDGDLEAVSTLDWNPTAPDWKFSTQRTRRISAAHALPKNGSGWTWAVGSYEWGVNDTNELYYPLTVEFGDLIAVVKLNLTKASNASTIITANVVRFDEPTGVATTIATGTNALNAPGITTITITAINHAVDVNSSYYLVVNSNNGLSIADKMRGAEINYTRP